VAKVAAPVAVAQAVNAPTAPAAVAVADSADPFVGSWRVAGEEGPNKGDLKITAANGAYRVSLGVGSPGCGGQVDGAAKREGDVLHMIGKLADVEDVCAIDITHHADGRLTLEEESDECRSFHGAQCDFAGTATRKTAATAARN
jgi:hypothetical protein